MKKIIAAILFFGSLGVAFAQVRGVSGNITWIFFDRPGSSDGACYVWHYNEGHPQYERCGPIFNTLSECQVATCNSQGNAPTTPPTPTTPPIAPSPSQSPRTPQYLAGLRSLGRQIGAANTPVFRPSSSSAYVLTLKAELFGVVFRNCPADLSRADLKNDYIVIKVSDGQPLYEITTPGFVSQVMRVEGNAQYWGIRVASPRYENSRIPVSVRDSVGQTVPLTVQAQACAS